MVSSGSNQKSIFDHDRLIGLQKLIFWSNHRFLILYDRSFHFLKIDFSIFLYTFTSFTFQGWIRYRSFCSGRTPGALVKTIKYSKFRIILIIPVGNLTLPLTLPYHTSYLTIRHITLHLTLHYLTLPYFTLLYLPYLTLPYLTIPYLTIPYLNHTICLTLPYYTLP